MPFGLRNAGQTFQRYINSILGDLNYCIAYFDDILIASSSQEEHLEHLRVVFQRLSDHGILLNPSKCVLGEPIVSFLGCQISDAGLAPLPDRVNALLNFPEPTTVPELRRFLAMINFYRRFLPNAAKTQAVLTEYLKGPGKANAGLTFSSDACLAFEKCKSDLANAAVLAHPSPSAPLSLMVDASDSAIGASLQQHVENAWQPLAFYSQKLTPAEQRYSTYDRELLASYKAIKHFRHMLEGKPFTLLTDHKPLTFAFHQRSDTCSPRQLRHLDFISQFTTDIKHISGRDNVVADAFSRIAMLTLPSPVSASDMASAQRDDQGLQAFLTDPSSTSLILRPFAIDGSDVPLYCDVSTSTIRPFVPVVHRHTVFLSVHNLSHPSIRCTIKALQQRFVWPSMKKDATAWARSCIPCQRSKVQRHTVTSPGNFAPVSSRFQHVHLDIVGPLPPCQGFLYCLTMIDRFSRWPEVVPMPDITAETVAQTFYTGWVSRFGCPLTITTDQGRQFESSLFRSLSSLLGTDRNRTTPYHPAANGLIERFHRPLKAAIMCHATSNWVDLLPTVLLGFRTTLKSDLKATCAELLYGTTLRIPGDFFTPSIPDPDPATFVSQLRRTMDTLRPIPASRHCATRSFVHPELSKCSHVFLRHDAVRTSLQPPYDGPYRVLSRTAKLFRLEVRGKPLTVSIDRVKPAYLSSADFFEAQHSSSSEPPVQPSETPPVLPSDEGVPDIPTPPVRTRSGRTVRFNPKYL